MNKISTTIKWKPEIIKARQKATELFEHTYKNYITDQLISGDTDIVYISADMVNTDATTFAWLMDIIGTFFFTECPRRYQAAYVKSDGIKSVAIMVYDIAKKLNKLIDDLAKAQQNADKCLNNPEKLSKLIAKIEDKKSEIAHYKKLLNNQCDD